METITKEPVQYSNIPYLETLDDVACYIIDMAECLENAFWDPLIFAAGSVVRAGEKNDDYNQLRRRTMALFLYAILQSNVSNLRLFLQSSDRDVSNCSLKLSEKFASKNVFRLHTAMDANQALHVISKGILPQLKNAIERECGIAPQHLNQARQMLYKIVSQERGIVQNMDFMMPVDPLPWMRYGTLPADIVREEIDFSIRESQRLFPPPV